MTSRAGPLASPLAGANRMTVARRTLSSDAFGLACHAAVPAVVDADFLHLLRANFFLDPPSVLTYESEAELLLSPLFRELGDGLYEIEPDLRSVLLIGLSSRYGSERVRQVALLLEMYTERTSVWRSRPELENVQRLTALNILDEEAAQRWLASAKAQASGQPALDSQWFLAVRDRLATLPAATATVEQSLHMVRRTLSEADPEQALTAVGQLAELAQLPGVDVDAVFRALREVAASATGAAQVSAASVLRRLTREGVAGQDALPEPDQSAAQVSPAEHEGAWDIIERIREEDGVVVGTVTEVVKGGLIVDVGVRGFLPASLVEMRRVRDLRPYVGKEIEAKITELDKERHLVMLSRRAWLEQTQSEVRRTFLETLRKGQIRRGVVSSIVNFGAFVDLGGVDGLVHVSELSWKHIDHPGEVVEIGQEVIVEVLEVDMDRERVLLSIKSTQDDPWERFARTHPVGQVVPGQVTKLVPFGAFVRVDEGIEGLVHISELAERPVEIPEQAVQVGDEIIVKIIDIDLDRRRLSLSRKQASAE
jgi:predicted RNA-binding protein with RPS1 domain